MQKQPNTIHIKANGLWPFFPALLIRPEGRILCSPEHGKLCLEALESEFSPLNHLPLQGLENILRSRGFVGLAEDRVAEALSLEMKIG